MRRLAVATAAGAAVAAVAFTAFGGTGKLRLPLHTSPLATARLTAILSGRQGSRLARLNPSTFAVERASAFKSGASWGWVRSPDGRRVAVATCRHTCDSFALRFASATRLRWEAGSIPLPGELKAAIWARPRTIYALVGGQTVLGLETIDTHAKKIVASKSVTGPLLQIARSSSGLVLLDGKFNAIVPARLVVIAADGSVRSIQLDRILAGTHYDQQSQDPVGAENLPGLAVDRHGGVAYVVDGSGLVAAVRLSDLSVTYHQVGGGSLLKRLADWLVPPAQAKNANGPTLSAQWLGDGLIAVTGSEETATPQVYTRRPVGLRIVDTRDWSVRMLDPLATSATVADGVLLATGISARYGDYGHVHSEGLAAYGSDGSLRWRLTKLGTFVFIFGAYRSYAMIDAGGKLRLVDLEKGRVVGNAPLSAFGLLLGAGSVSAS